MIIIKNVKLFTLDVNHKCHWSKLPKLEEIMHENILSFSYGADLRGADLKGKNKNTLNNLTIIDFCIFDRFGSHNRQTTF